MTAPTIILVEPQLAENIGMVARAMANFGLSNLFIVNPREDYLSEKALSAASNAKQILINAKTYANLKDVLKDFNVVYATTARSRYSYKKVFSPNVAMQQAKIEIEQHFKDVAILFGRERTGLTNEEITLADYIITFPVNSHCSSVNLAQSVLLISYEWMKSAMPDINKPKFSGLKMNIAKKKSLYDLFTHLEKSLEKRGYFKSKEKSTIMKNNLRDLLTNANFSEQEIKLLRGVISSLDKFNPQNISRERKNA